MITGFMVLKSTKSSILSCVSTWPVFLNEDFIMSLAVSMFCAIAYMLPPAYSYKPHRTIQTISRFILYYKIYFQRLGYWLDR